MEHAQKIVLVNSHDENKTIVTSAYIFYYDRILKKSYTSTPKSYYKNTMEHLIDETNHGFSMDCVEVINMETADDKEKKEIKEIEIEYNEYLNSYLQKSKIMSSVALGVTSLISLTSGGLAIYNLLHENNEHIFTLVGGLAASTLGQIISTNAIIKIDNKLNELEIEKEARILEKRLHNNTKLT